MPKIRYIARIEIQNRDIEEGVAVEVTAGDRQGSRPERLDDIGVARGEIAALVAEEVDLFEEVEQRQVVTAVAIEIADDDADQLGGVEHVAEILLGQVELAVAAAEPEVGEAVLIGDHEIGVAVGVAGLIGGERRAQVGDRNGGRRTVELVDPRRLEGAVAAPDGDGHLFLFAVDDGEIEPAVFVDVGEREGLRA